MKTIKYLFFHHKKKLPSKDSWRLLSAQGKRDSLSPLGHSTVDVYSHKLLIEHIQKISEWVGKRQIMGILPWFFNRQCVEFILCKLFISPLPACPEWLVAMVNRNLENFPLAFFLAVFYAFLGLCLFRVFIPIKSQSFISIN